MAAPLPDDEAPILLSSPLETIVTDDYFAAPEGPDWAQVRVAFEGATGLAAEEPRDAAADGGDGGGGGAAAGASLKVELAPVVHQPGPKAGAGARRRWGTSVGAPATTWSR